MNNKINLKKLNILSVFTKNCVVNAAFTHTSVAGVYVRAEAATVRTVDGHSRVILHHRGTHLV